MNSNSKFENICSAAKREVYTTPIAGHVQKDDYETIKKYAQFCGCPARKVKQKLIDFACGHVMERAENNESFKLWLKVNS
tara:strand:- start:950 stop:1189 length:240 start_codon:yes stop_codon:yes gene_type:complete